MTTIDAINLAGIIFILITFGGFYFAYLYGRKTKNFHWSEYIAIIFFPIVDVLFLAYIFGIKILALFIISSFAGFFIEYIGGLTYHKTLNKRLWVYERLSVGGYTSLLSIPLWGIVGTIFWFLGKLIGL